MRDDSEQRSSSALDPGVKRPRWGVDWIGFISPSCQYCKRFGLAPEFEDTIQSIGPRFRVIGDEGYAPRPSVDGDQYREVVGEDLKSVGDSICNIAQREGFILS